MAILLLCSSVYAQMPGSQYGQTSVKLYRSKNDSLQNLMLEKKIDEELVRKPLRQKKIDSLMELQRKIQTERVIFKVIYRPSRNFILTDSLKESTDFNGITRVSIYNKKDMPDVLWRCKDLEVLELINTSIKKLPAKMGSLAGLKTVYIYNNHSSRPLRLTKNEHITSLTIRNQTPGGVPRSFRKLTALSKLDLAENALIKFPNGGRRNKKLTELSLQRNALNLRKKIKKHRHLERLSLHNNEIEYVPASIKNLRNLKKLNLNSNKITSVHRAINKLQMLEQLSFYNNQLTEIPKGIYELNSLKEIDLFHNQIGNIDPQFSNWQNLQVLYLSHNKLVELPENIDTLKMLEGLYVWDNRLGELSESIGNLPKMKFLRVNNNYLKTLPSSILKLENLEELDISHNYITAVPEEIFNYRKLRIIAMVNNPWNDLTLEFLKRKTEELKTKDIFIHISDQEK